MAQWGVNDAASNSVWWGVSNHKTVANSANRTAFYGNTTVGAFDGGAPRAVGQYGVDATEVANSTFAGTAHQGWNVRKEGTGELQSITVDAGGTSYSNSDTVEVVAASGANAAANVVTDGSGVIQSVTISSAGGLYTSSPTINITTGTGSNASLSAVVGGRAGRVSFETLVAAKIS